MAETPATTTYLALLRGINVGGKNLLPMADLRVLVGEAGGVDVRTYIQSGNVIFRATPDVARDLPARVGVAIAERFGLRVPVILRSADAVAAVVGGNPFLASDPAVAQQELHVVFLADTPENARATRLDPARSQPDQFRLCGRELYLRTPNGLGRSKLTNDYFDRTLATISTTRNWRTTLALHALLQA